MPPKEQQGRKRPREESKGASRRSRSAGSQRASRDKKKTTTTTTTIAGPSRGKISRKPSKGAPSEPDEKYVVIIQNVENDFAKVHQHNLPGYCHLAPDRNEANRPPAGHSDARGGGGGGGCTYGILCRSETRSAELTVRGPADAPLDAIFAPSGAFPSLAAMVRGLSHRRYFTHPPHLHVSSPPPDGPVVRQRDLVSAVAVVSASWRARAVRARLRELPGFLTCWRLYARHFRAVFRDPESLFRAKQLLSQFHLEGNVRVEVRLSDAHARAFADFVTAQEEGATAGIGLG